MDRIYDRRMSRQEQKYRNEEHVARIRGEHESRIKVASKERKEFTVEQQRAAIEELTKVRKLNEKYAQIALEQVVEAIETKESSDFCPPPEVPTEGKIRAKAKQGRDKSMDCSSVQTHSQDAPPTILEEPEATSSRVKTSELLATLLGELADCQEQDKSTKLLQLLISTSLDFKENSTSLSLPEKISIKSLRKLIRESSPVLTEPQLQASPTV